MIGVCGEALIDFTPTDIGGETAYIPRPGGSPCNVAVGLARLGKRTAFIGKISSDKFGDMLHAYLAQNGVDLRLLARGNEPSALAFVLPSKGGGHDFAFYGRDTAEQQLAHADIPAALPHDLTALHFGSYSLMLGSSAQTYESLMRRESKARIISLDPNVRPALYPNRTAYRKRIEGLLPHAAIVKASEDDLAWLYPGESPADVGARWLSKGASVVVVTLGANGAIGLSAAANANANTDAAINAVIHSPASAVDVADSVGAGDAFMAGLLARLDDGGLLRRNALASLPNDALADAMAYANRAAAVACTRPGADPPHKSDMNG